MSTPYRNLLYQFHEYQEPGYYKYSLAVVFQAAIYLRDIDTGGLGFPGVVIACSRFVAAIRWLPVVSFRAGRPTEGRTGSAGRLPMTGSTEERTVNDRKFYRAPSALLNTIPWPPHQPVTVLPCDVRIS